MKIDAYQSETDSYIALELAEKVKYIGESFGVDALTDGKTYDIVIQKNGDFAVVDDSGEDYLYSLINPHPADGSSPGGKFELLESYNDILSEIYAREND